MDRPFCRICFNPFRYMRAATVLKPTQTQRTKLILSGVSGILLTASFPNIQWSFLAWIALVPLLAAIRDLTPGQAFRNGMITGLVHGVTLMYWVVYTMQKYGYLPWWLSISILFLFAAYLALYPALFSFILAKYCKTPGVLFLWASSLWAALEYIRTVFFTGFPWELLGYSQYKNLHIIQISDMFGPYGVSFLIVAVNVAILMVLLFLAGKTWHGKTIDRSCAMTAVTTALVMVVCAWGYGRVQAGNVDKQEKETVKVALVQGNIDQAHKWDPAYQIVTTSRYRKLSLGLKSQKPDLVVWPETATPFYLFRSRELTALVLDTVRETGADFIIGSPHMEAVEKNVSHYNTAYLVDAKGEIKGQYNKVHLVPFGEYVPLKKWLPFIGKMVAQVGDFKPGKKGAALPWKPEQGIGALICYEVIFPDLSRSVVKNGAGLLVNITNDAWFGKSAATLQHFSMAVFRAVENKRALVRCANTGISGVIDPLGRVIEKTGIFKEAVLVGKVPIMRTSTFYTRFGDLFAYLCIMVMALTVFVPHIRHYVNTKT